MSMLWELVPSTICAAIVARSYVVDVLSLRRRVKTLESPPKSMTIVVLGQSRFVVGERVRMGAGYPERDPQGAWVVIRKSSSCTEFRELPCE